MSALTATIRIRFPRVLGELNYAHRVSRHPVEIDGIETLQWYCSWATDGIKYERYVQSAENLANPNSLTTGNVSNLSSVRGRGWSWASLNGFLNHPLRELESIPVDASLFLTKRYDDIIIQLVNSFCQLRGTKLANATKLLYQKRRGLIPIVDEFARRVFDLPWIDGAPDDFSKVLRMAFAHIREIESLNAAGLDELQAWSIAHPEETGGLSFSRLRLIDILAWGVIKREELASV
jgi:hypothetical protein